MSFNNVAIQAPAQDIEVKESPPDSISSLSWSSQADLLSAGCWDNSVRIYEVGTNCQSRGKAIYSHEGPVLSVCWNNDGSKVFSGGADNVGRMYDLQSGTPTQVAAHNDSVKAVKWIDAHGGILATGSWDKTVKYWDLRQSVPIATATLPDRCYTMDVAYPFMVVGCANKRINVYNLTDPTRVYKSSDSPLKLQTRVIACFPGSGAYAVGSVEGRIAITYIDDNPKAARSYSFRCHRREQSPQRKDHTLVFAVNDISVHPQHGTFSSAGADGIINFWDGESRVRLKSTERVIGSIACTAFNRTGSILSYAISYDWSKGHSGNVPEHPNKIMLHMCKDEEVKRRSKK